MIQKGQLILLPARVFLNNPKLRLGPLGVAPQRDRRPRTISDYTLFFDNEDMVEIPLGGCMQFGHALWRVLKQLKYENPKIGPIYLSKIIIIWHLF
jgi:hypothetical protein